MARAATAKSSSGHPAPPDSYPDTSPAAGGDPCSSPTADPTPYPPTPTYAPTPASDAFPTPGPGQHSRMPAAGGPSTNSATHRSPTSAKKASPPSCSKPKVDTKTPAPSPATPNPASKPSPPSPPNSTADAATDNDTDVDVDVDDNLDLASLSIVSPPTNATVTALADGTVWSDPNQGFEGIDSFDYQICDTAGACDTATVTVVVGDAACTISGTDGDDTLTGTEHTTDTAGYTDLIFGLFDLCGLRFSPRIKDLGDQRLWRLPQTQTNGPAADLLRHRIRPERIIERWDDMQRVAATIRHGHVPASLLIARLQGSASQNKLTQAIQECGRIIKTISIARYLADEEHRRRIHTQLNKGESIHALRNAIRYANARQIRRRDNADQDLEGECLTLITNA
ncbi:MAG: Tn3 family transposase, partial [bacterium]|nr:Tn3 family transposase [bacterium]